ncbi:MAG: hypothetical protein IKV28_00210 [Bacteroidales bacterium]|nr:hypothetical protein [Bacteroidales bacterium]
MKTRHIWASSLFWGALCWLLGTTTMLQAQDKRSEYERFKQERQKEFKDYYTKANAEFSKYLQDAWAEFVLLPAEPFNPGPKPKQPPVAPDRPVLDEPLIDLPDLEDPKGDVLNLERVPIPRVDPIPVRPTQPKLPNFEWNFYGIPMKVSQPASAVKLTGTTESLLSAAWDQCADGRFAATLADLKNYREQYGLADWSYYLLTQAYARQCSQQKSEQVMIQFYLMTQSGYSTRLMRCGEQVYLLMASQNRIAERSMFSIENNYFYVMDPAFKSAGKPCYICNFKFPGEQQMNLFMAAPPKFPSSDPAAVRTIASRRYPQVQLKMAVNANLKAFYETYPLSNDFNVYSTAQFSEPNQTMIDECLRPMMRGKSQIEAANLLINLVQTGFEYKTDGDQFGRERPMFSEELFFYPYSDCEDRSALYALLVRELLDLDVVLIHYPGHLATAVCFTEPVKGGASFEYKGKTYVICDPTYIGADIGLQMPDMNKIEEVFPSNGLRNN